MQNVVFYPIIVVAQALSQFCVGQPDEEALPPVTSPPPTMSRRVQCVASTVFDFMVFLTLGVSCVIEGIARAALAPAVLLFSLLSRITNDPLISRDSWTKIESHVYPHFITLFTVTVIVPALIAAHILYYIGLGMVEVATLLFENRACIAEFCCQVCVAACIQVAVELVCVMLCAAISGGRY